MARPPELQARRRVLEGPHRHTAACEARVPAFEEPERPQGDPASPVDVAPLRQAQLRARELDGLGVAIGAGQASASCERHG
jgi:hypothetical protein